MQRARRERSIRSFLAFGAMVLLTIGGLAPVRHFDAAEGDAGELSPLGIEIVGQPSWLPGSTAGLRIVVTDHARGVPASRARVAVRLQGQESGRRSTLYSGTTDRLGTVQAAFDVPELPIGAYDLTVTAAYRGRTEEAARVITLAESSQVLLTTDKPIYQPGQIMHLRALALKRPALDALSGREVTLEVSDGKGNKVFKQALETNDFGIVSADFQLADEVNMGDYKVKAIVGEDVAEKTVVVKKYVLPKYKVTVTTDRDYYLPGERVEGKVQADYFFGKPTSDAKVAVRVSTFDVALTQIAVCEGKTDANGTYAFECDLPDAFVGQPIEQGNAFLQFDVEVVDQAEHTENAVHTASVAAGHVRLNAVPESGTLVPGVENTVYVLASRPTGEPVEATVNVLSATAGGEALAQPRAAIRTDALGIAEVVLTPTALAAPNADAGGIGGFGGGMMGPGMGGFDGGDVASGMPVSLSLSASLADGSETEATIDLPVDAAGSDALLLRLDKAVAEVGDTIRARAFTAAKGGAIYFDVLKDKQTMLTAAADVRDGSGEATLRLTPELTGTLYVNAYRINPSGQIVRDTRPLFVQPASDLAIDIEADQETYLPGSEATLQFAVTNSDGKPVAAALGINVVDESVFALQELQPGMEKVFFYLEQELMKPRYEIHGFEMASLVSEPTRDSRPVDRAAQVLFAGVEPPAPEVLQVDTFAQRAGEVKGAWAEEMTPLLQRIQDGLQKYVEAQGERGGEAAAEVTLAKLVAGGVLKSEDARDKWGREVKLSPSADRSLGWANVAVVSAGPDGRFETYDDVIMSLMAPGMWFADEEGARNVHLAWGRGGMGGGGFGGRGALGLAGAKGEMGPGGMAVERDMMDFAVPSAAEPETASGGAPVRVREYFPETMYFEPSLITGADGKATLTMPMADSITTWRLAAIANSAVGQLGSTTTGLRCFQDFFVDIDLPVALTQGDEVSIPVAVYNYLPGEQSVRLELETGEWFTLSGEATQTLEIAANDVDVRYYHLKVHDIGDHTLTVRAYGSKMNDAIRRTIEVTPDGHMQEVTANGRLRGDVEETVEIPADAVPGASKILVKVYPGIFSQIVEGLDSVLRMPSGCFEQTSSATWPNIMVLDYMKSTGQITPEIRMKAEGLINTGYQRMVAYEVPGGGFSWFGDAPANKLLTAYGLMEFFDMSAVHSVDPAIIARTQQWLLGQADANGVYQPDASHYHAETWGRVQVNELLPTAYVVWGLTHSGCTDARIAKSAAYVRANWKKASEPYSLAIVCNGLVGADNALAEGKLSPETEEALKALVGMAQTEGEKMWWGSKISGVTNSTGISADLEATGMAVLALMRSGLYTAEVTQVLTYLIETKDPNGTWYSTNATMLALRALTMAQKGATSKSDGEVIVECGGKQVGAFAITPDDADVVRVIDCGEAVQPGANKIRVRYAGEGGALYQVVGRYYTPWKGVAPETLEALSIQVTYDKTQLAKDDTVQANVEIRNNTPATTSMVVVDLGVPPGFTVDSGSFAELVDQGVIDRYNMTGRQVIVYFEELAPNQEIEFSYGLTARFPLKAKTPKSTVYEYYNTENRSDAEPVEMVVE